MIQYTLIISPSSHPHPGKKNIFLVLDSEKETVNSISLRYDEVERCLGKNTYVYKELGKFDITDPFHSICIRDIELSFLETESETLIETILRDKRKPGVVLKFLLRELEGYLEEESGLSSDFDEMFD